jgi:hypothetical protein
MAHDPIARGRDVRQVVVRVLARADHHGAADLRLSTREERRVRPVLDLLALRRALAHGSAEQVVAHDLIAAAALDRAAGARRGDRRVQAARERDAVGRDAPLVCPPRNPSCARTGSTPGNVSRQASVSTIARSDMERAVAIGRRRADDHVLLWEDADPTAQVRRDHPGGLRRLGRRDDQQLADRQSHSRSSHSDGARRGGSARRCRLDVQRGERCDGLRGDLARPSGGLDDLAETVLSVGSGGPRAARSQSSTALAGAGSAAESRGGPALALLWRCQRAYRREYRGRWQVCRRPGIGSTQGHRRPRPGWSLREARPRNSPRATRGKRYMLVDLESAFHAVEHAPAEVLSGLSFRPLRTAALRTGRIGSHGTGLT